MCFRSINKLGLAVLLFFINKIKKQNCTVKRLDLLVNIHWHITVYYFTSPHKEIVLWILYECVTRLGPASAASPRTVPQLFYWTQSRAILTRDQWKPSTCIQCLRPRFKPLPSCADQSTSYEKVLKWRKGSTPHYNVLGPHSDSAVLVWGILTWVFCQAKQANTFVRRHKKLF